MQFLFSAMETFLEFTGMSKMVYKDCFSFFVYKENKMHKSEFHQFYSPVCYELITLAQTFLMPHIQNITKYLFSI